MENSELLSHTHTNLNLHLLAPLRMCLHGLKQQSLAKKTQIKQGHSASTTQSSPSCPQDMHESWGHLQAPAGDSSNNQELSTRSISGIGDPRKADPRKARQGEPQEHSHPLPQRAPAPATSSVTAGRAWGCLPTQASHPTVGRSRAHPALSQILPPR